jgi:hypothetical protein
MRFQVGLYRPSLLAGRIWICLRLPSMAHDENVLIGAVDALGEADRFLDK